MTGYGPSAHYDRVTAGWRLLLGEELHYGVFETGEETLAEATTALTDLMIEAAAVAPGDKVLDVGCGSGAAACRLTAERGARVTGISTSEAGLEAARERGAGLDVSFERRDGMDNGFPDASFDCVWALESSHLMRRRERLVAECARVLRPGGRLALCDIVLRRPLPFDEVRRLREPLTLLRDVFGDAHMEPLDRYCELASAHGLTVDRRLDLTAATRPTFDRWRRNAARNHEAASAALGGDYLERFVAACGVLERFWDDGTLGYGLLSARRPFQDPQRTSGGGGSSRPRRPRIDS